MAEYRSGPMQDVGYHVTRRRAGVVEVQEPTELCIHNLHPVARRCPITKGKNCIMPPVRPQTESMIYASY